jgi:hypothetical protein
MADPEPPPEPREPPVETRPESAHPLVKGLGLPGQTEEPAPPLTRRGTDLQERLEKLPLISDDAASKIGRRGPRERVRMEGYLAGRFQASEDSWWLLLYLDDAANSYALLPEDGLLNWIRQPDRTAAYGLRDIVWLESDARILEGDYMQPISGRFTVGNFTRARDFRASFRGGTQDSLSELGPLCTANTPCCCGGKSR